MKSGVASIIFATAVVAAVSTLSLERAYVTRRCYRRLAVYGTTRPPRAIAS